MNFWRLHAMPHISRSIMPIKRCVNSIMTTLWQAILSFPEKNERKSSQNWMKLIPPSSMIKDRLKPIVSSNPMIQEILANDVLSGKDLKNIREELGISLEQIAEMA